MAETFKYAGIEYEEIAVENIKTYRERFPKGQIILLPLAKGKKGEYGSAIEWDIRVHKEGIAGPQPLKVETVRSLGGLAEREPEGVISATKVVKAELESKYPYIQPTKLTELEEKIRKAIEVPAKEVPEKKKIPTTVKETQI